MNVSSKLVPVKNFVTSKTARQVLKGRKYSPQVLFVAGTVGVITSTVLACKATLKLEEAVAEHNADLASARDLHQSDPETYPAKDFRGDVTKLYVRKTVALGRLYGPALGLGAASVCALGGSHLILTRRNAGLVAAYAALDKGFEDYRERVLELVGPDKERELRFKSEQREVVEETEQGPEVKTVTSAIPGAPSLYSRFFDQTSPNWNPRPEYNKLFLTCQQNYLNDLLRSRGHVFLNEVYDALGLDRTKAGQVVGWVISKDGDNYIDFGVYNSESERAREFVNGREASVLLDFNVDGVIFDKI